jgi:dTDP-glucose pyrophosphorylase
LVHEHEEVCIGLPDTIWFPESALATLPKRVFSLLLFPVEHPENFDAVVTDARDEVIEVQVKSPQAGSRWVWGAMKMPGDVLHQLHRLWLDRNDEYLGTLFSEYISRGGHICGFKTGTAYVDTGTLNGYREALRVLDANCLATHRA